MNSEGKTKRRGMTFGKTAATKKAIVKLTEDSKEIEIFPGTSNKKYHQYHPPASPGRRTIRLVKP